MLVHPCDVVLVRCPAFASFLYLHVQFELTGTA